MSQATTISPSPQKPEEAHSSPRALPVMRRHLSAINHEEVQAEYKIKSAKLLSALEETRKLVRDVQEANARPKFMHYPKPERGSTSLLQQALAASSTASLESHLGEETVVGEEEVVGGGEEGGGSLKVIGLDIQLGNSPRSPRLLTSLEPASLATLLDAQFESAVAHLDRLSSRVKDTSSKVLVTGDVNAGKSTFVNGLLRRTVVPSDQQPLTTAFCEVMDASLNGGVEEAHLVLPSAPYNRLDARTYKSVGLEHLDEVAAEWDAEDGRMIKVYCHEGKGEGEMGEDGLLSNGAVDVALVDSPGLNTDSLKTLACFAFQEEIDVVVFVVNSENHFTQSGREFMLTAGKEKAYIFVVVNKFDLIRRQDRCREAIMKQLQEVSPDTYRDAADLVHFVSAEKARKARVGEGEEGVPEEWLRMERSLRGFILEKRAKSKLGPAQNYLLQLLGDIGTLARVNRRRTEESAKEAERSLSDAIPRCRGVEEDMRRDVLEGERIVDGVVDAIGEETRSRLARVAESLEDRVKDPEWHGWLHAWSYIEEVREGMVRAWEREVGVCERCGTERVYEGARRVLKLGARLVGQPAREADFSRMFEERRSTSKLSRKGKGRGGKGGDATFLFSIDPSDLIDVKERLGLATVSVGGLAIMGGQLLGARRVLMDVVSFGGLLGGRLSGQLLAVGIVASAIGVGLYILGDIQHAVQRKVASKCRKVLLSEGIMDAQVDRITRRTHTALRFGVQDLQRRYELVVEEAQREKAEGEKVVREATEGRRYFRALSRRVRELEEMIRAVDTTAKKVPL